MRAPAVFRFMLLLSLLTGAVFAQVTRNVPAQFATIQAAIVASANGDTVLVAPGTYSGAINFLGKAITVISSGGPSTTYMVGSSAGRAVTFATNEGPSSLLSGFTISGGAGGILCQRSSPTIAQCVVINNVSPSSGGGGLAVLANLNFSTASPIVTGCTFSNNIGGGSGGGALVEIMDGGSSNTTFSNCSFLGNFSLLNGGGLGLVKTSGNGAISTTLNNCLFEANVASSAGGGISLDNFATANLSKCRIIDNVAAGGGSSGGGVRAFVGNLNMVNCIVAGNTAFSVGGGISMTHFGAPQFGKIENCTITDNTAGGTGGIFIDSNGTGTDTIIGSIVYGNSLPNIGGNTIGAINATFSCIEQPTIVALGATNITTNPRFVDPANGDFHLAANSPCIGTGSVGTLPTATTDFDGSPRIVGTIDMGADEVPVLAFPGSGDDLDLYVLINGGGDPLASTHAATAATTLTFTMKSPGGTLNGALPLLAGQFFTPAFPPSGLLAYPYVHLDNGPTFVIQGYFGSGPFFSPGLDPAGITITTLVPTGLAGFGLRLQGLAVTPFVTNGLFAASNAHDILF